MVRPTTVGQVTRGLGAGQDEPLREMADRLGTLRDEVDSLRTRRHHLGYRESIGWARDADAVVDEIAAEAAVAPSRALLGLVELMIGRTVKVIMQADDSSGAIGDVVRQLLGIHERLCDRGVADPVGLAKWLIKFGIVDQDLFNPDPVRYAAALGDKGLVFFRRGVEERAAEGKVPFAVRYCRERLAVLDGDVDQIVALLGGDLSGPYHFIRVAEAMLELGRDDDALFWARRGIESTSGWQVAKLYDIACGVLGGCDETGAVLDLRRGQHRRMPSATTYSQLRSAAEALEVWPAEIEAARSALGARDPGGLVDALLADGDVETAWPVALPLDGGELDDRRLARLAEAREPTDPNGAMGAYLRLARSALRTADRSAYQAAAKLLKHARRAAKAADRSAEFDEHLAQLREHNRRRPTLIAMLDKAGLR